MLHSLWCNSKSPPPFPSSYHDIPVSPFPAEINSDIGGGGTNTSGGSGIHATFNIWRGIHCGILSIPFFEGDCHSVFSSINIFSTAKTFIYSYTGASPSFSFPIDVNDDETPLNNRKGRILPCGMCSSPKLCF